MMTKDTFVLYAMKAYDNPQCKTIVEFEEDVAKFSHLAKLCARDMKEIESHLLLNYTLTLLNVFSSNECIKMMFFKVKQEDWYKLKTVLVFLNRMPSSVSDVNVSDLKICPHITQVLQKI